MSMGPSPRYAHQSPFPQAGNRPSIPYLGAPEDEMARGFFDTYFNLSSYLTTSAVFPHDIAEVNDAVAQAGVTLKPILLRSITPVVAFYAGYEGQALQNLITAQDGWEDMRKGEVEKAGPKLPKLLSPTIFTPRPSSPIHNPLGPVTRHVAAAESLTLNLVTSITSTQLGKIRAAIQDSIARGITVQQTGKRISTLVGLFPRWQTAVENFRANLERQGFGEATIEKRVATYHAKLLRVRGTMIARTELVRALNAGRLAGWWDLADRGKLDAEKSIKTWVTAPGACDECLEMEGVEVEGLDTEFETPYGTMEMPPMHPNCRCSVNIKRVRAGE